LLAASCVRALFGRKCENACWLRGDSEEEEEEAAFLSLYQCLTSSQLQGLVHHHPYCWTLKMMIQMICLQFNENCLLFKLLLVCQMK
jgi:hypothetical protein